MVLKEVLKYILDKKQIKVSEISQELDIPIGLVECAIRTLKDLKYLMPAKSSSESCLLCESCYSGRRETKMFKCYMITEKGRKLLSDFHD